MFMCVCVCLHASVCVCLSVYMFRLYVLNIVKLNNQLNKFCCFSFYNYHMLLMGHVLSSEAHVCAGNDNCALAQGTSDMKHIIVKFVCKFITSKLHRLKHGGLVV